MRDALERQLTAVRARIRRLTDECALHRATGRNALADRLEEELKKAQVECGHLEHLLRSAE